MKSKIFSSLMLAAALAGCGGGSGGSDENLTPDNGDTSPAPTNSDVNRAPVVSVFSASKSTLELNESVQLNILALDPDNDAITCQVDTDGDGTADQSFDDCQQNKTFNISFANAGTYNLSVTASDGEFSASKTLTITVNDVVEIPNNKPIITTFSKADSGSVYDGQAFSLNILGSDADSDPLTCTLDTNNDGNADLTIADCETNQTVSITLNGVGPHIIGLSISDGESTASQLLTVTVIDTPNNKPIITIFSQADSGSVYDGQAFSLNILGADADSDPLICILDIDNDGTADLTVIGCEANQTVSVTLNGVGIHAIRLTISDGKDVVSDVINILASNASTPPTIAKFALASTATIYEGQTFSVLLRAEDTDSTELTCQLDSDGDGSYDQTIGECQNLQAVNLSMASAGDHTLRLKVSDGINVVTENLNISVEASTSALPEVVSFKLLSPLPIRPNTGVKFEVIGRDTDSSITCSLKVNGSGWSEGPDSTCVADGNIINAGFYELGTYTPTLTITETNGLKRSTIMALPVSVVDNQPPVLNDVKVADRTTTIRPDQAVYFNWDVTDLENDELTCFIDKDNDGIQDNTYSDCDRARVSFSAAGTYTVRAKVIDSFDAESALRSAVVEVVDNTPAMINSFEFDKTRVRKNDPVTLTWDMSDADGDQLRCDLDANDDGKYGNWDDGDRRLYKCDDADSSSFDMTFATEGEHRVNVKVRDTFSEVNATAALTVYPNTAPKITEFRLNNIPPIKVGDDVSFHIAATDVDADELNCALDLDDNGTFDTDLGSCTTPIDFTVAAPSTGVFDVALQVTDTYQGKTTQVLKVTNYDHEITVNTQDDLVGVDVSNGTCTTTSGLCSLRAAVMLANHIHTSTGAPSIINLPAGTFTLTIPQQYGQESGDLNVEGNIYVAGVSAEATIIDGNGAVLETRLFHVRPGASVTGFKNVTLQNGNGQDQGGGALYIAGGDLHLLNVNIKNNKGTSSIVDTLHGRVYVENSKFFNNTSTSGRGILRAGDPIDVRNSEFSGNLSTGGAIYLNDVYKTDAWSVIEGTKFDNNSSSNDGGAIYHREGNLKIIGSSFTQNSAINKGGAIAQYSGNIQVSSTVFESNTAGFGGAVHSSNVLNLTNTLLIRNAATNNGGAVFFTNSDVDEPLSLNYVTLMNNSAVGNGGAIYEGNSSASAASVYLKGTILQANTASTGSNCFGTINSSGYNLIESEESCVAAFNLTDSIAEVTLLESTDAVTGMTTATLPFGDSRINSIPTADCTNVNDEVISIDQLGNARPQGDGCEPGALEIVE